MTALFEVGIKSVKKCITINKLRKLKQWGIERLIRGNRGAVAWESSISLIRQHIRGIRVP